MECRANPEHCRAEPVGHAVRKPCIRNPNVRCRGVDERVAASSSAFPLPVRDMVAGIDSHDGVHASFAKNRRIPAERPVA